MDRGDNPFSVLIIDSDNVRRGMLACTLPVSLYSLEFARSAEAGLDLLGELLPEVVIVGWDSGTQDLCQRIRSLPAGSQSIVVLMDERFRDDSTGKSEAESAGADTYLPFPFESSILKERLQYAQKKIKLPHLSRSPIPQDSLAFAATLPEEHHLDEKLTEAEEQDSWELFRRNIKSLSDKLDFMNYYEVLQVPASTPAAEIKTAYFNHSMELHPDRFMQLEDADLKHQIYEVYKRMSEAFKVLIDPEARSLYDSALAGADARKNLRFLERQRGMPRADDATADALTPGGKKHLRFSMLALAEGNLRSTRMYLTLALQCEPHNDALRRRLEQITQKLDS